MAGVKGKVLVKMHWGGRFKGKLWTMVDPQGKDAKKGSPIDTLARLNKGGIDADNAIQEREDIGADCRGRIQYIHKENKRVAGKCAMVMKALKQAGHRQNEGLKGYTKALRDVEAAKATIVTAEKAMNEQVAVLEKARDEYARFELKKHAEEKSKDLDKLRKERDATIGAIKKVLGYAKLIKAKNLEGIAFAAMNRVATHIVKVDYEPKIKALKSEISNLQSQIGELDKAIMEGKVEVAAKGLEKQLANLNEKEKKLNNALLTASENRKSAMDALDGIGEKNRKTTPAMSGLADIIDGRAFHIKKVEWAKSAIVDYKDKLERLERDLSTLSGLYGSVEGVLKKAVKKDKSLDPTSEYGKAIRKLAGLNASLVYSWRIHADQEIRWCNKQLNYLNDDGGKNGPFAGFNEIRKMIIDTRHERQIKLGERGLKCPA